jgi:hypothetical protein
VRRLACRARGAPPGPQNRQRARDLQYVERVGSAGAIVAEAIEQHAADRRPGPALRRLVDPHLQGERQKRHAVQVAGDLALGGEQDERGGVVVEIVDFLVLEARGPGDGLDRFGIGGQKTPGVVADRLFERVQVIGLLGAGQLRRLVRIEGERENPVILARHELRLADDVLDAVQQDVADIRALVIDERQNDGPVHEIAQGKLAAVLILHEHVERHGVPELFVNADLGPGATAKRDINNNDEDARRYDASSHDTLHEQGRESGDFSTRRTYWTCKRSQAPSCLPITPDVTSTCDTAIVCPLPGRTVFATVFLTYNNVLDRLCTAKLARRIPLKYSRRQYDSNMLA